MAHGAPEHCPACGTALEAVDPPTVKRCSTCEEYVFHNPVPNCRVVVVDDDAALLVEILDAYRVEDPPYTDASEWMVPGGQPKVGEQPAETAARELAEETNLTVDPTDLVLFDAVSRQVVAGTHALVCCFAVERSKTDGPLRADSDAGDARFFTPAELAASDRRFRELAVEPDRCRSFEWWTEAARSAVPGAD
ncbi:NUDIX domain-containing protein [Salinirubellus salinus]|uniref:NUDIX domain-containing protein n=1 Tax=Salinirubellus salinus TaxID=1364945 RepID=A0A9E7U3S4_9EURY|nr:NUDIX domain-containing protein [Salinirubellus salinus]UWM53550.1 NUDIX domain-containing protein [Salinirubellus salinus]